MPLEGIRLLLSASSGLTLPETVAITGIDGIARVSVTLGSSPAVGSVVATVASRTTATAEIAVTATERPLIETVTPSTFASGDTVEVSGSFWPAGEAATVFAGAFGFRTVSSTPQSVLVVVPPCVGSGPVQLSVAFGDLVSTQPTMAEITLTEEGMRLSPGQGVTVPAALLEECLRMGGPDAEYVIVPQFGVPGPADAVTAQTPVQTAFRLVTGAGGTPVTSRASFSLGRTPPPSLQVTFEQRRRLNESLLASQAAAAGPQPLAPGDAPSLQAVAPEQRQFHILETLDEPATFAQITARLRYGGDRVLVYQDLAAPSGGFTDTDFQQLGRLFDSDLYTLAVHSFGAPSDVDNDGRIIVLLSPKVNGLSPYPDCQVSGVVNGYFWGRDLILPALPNSNAGEIFYASVPDPQGSAGGCPQSAASVRQSVPATFIHELQHMISFNQHVMARGGRQEANWLNEGLSHIAEELASLVYELDPGQPRQSPSQLFPDSSQGFIVPNMLNAMDYLQSPTVSSITMFQQLGTLPERGAAWLFLRWLGDQKGPDIYRRLVETRYTGAENVERQAGESFQRLFGDFTLALYADLNPDVDRALLDDRHMFQTRDFRVVFARFHELGELPDPFPISAAALPPDGTTNGTMVPGTMDFFTLQGGPENTLLQYTAPGGGTFPAALFPQVGILRIR